MREECIREFVNEKVICQWESEIKFSCYIMKDRLGKPDWYRNTDYTECMTGPCTYEG